MSPDGKVVTFGEIMMRLAPPGRLRFTQARSFDVIYGGGEANVAVSLANYGAPVDYVTRLPANDLGEACIQFLRQYGVGTAKIVRGGERLGIYFLEMGAAQRGSAVIYDRANSAIATIQRGIIDWEAVLADVVGRQSRHVVRRHAVVGQRHRHIGLAASVDHVE